GGAAVRLHGEPESGFAAVVRDVPGAGGADVRVAVHRHRGGVYGDEGDAKPAVAGDAAGVATAVHHGQRAARAERSGGGGDVVLPVRDADADARADGGAAGHPLVAAGGGHSGGVADDGAVRLGGGAHLPRRPADAGQGGAAGRDAQV